MSNAKVTAKNLQYRTALPPFLQRLHAQGSAGGDRHERPQARPTRARDAAADQEDEPAYVDEEGAPLSTGELEALKNGGGSAMEDALAAAESAVDKEVGGKDKTPTVGIGAVRKRKAGRVISEVGKDPNARADTDDDEERGKDEPEIPKSGVEKKPKPKKGKKIKLSFNDDE